MSTGREQTYVPIIDISALWKDGTSEEERREVAQKINQACTNVGFLLIENHGGDANIIEKAWDITAKFFDQDLDVKKGVDNHLVMNENYPYGYSPYGGEILGKGKALDRDEDRPDSPSSVDFEKTKAGDMKEMFAVGPYNEASNMPGPRYAPTPEGMPEVWKAYYQEMEKLAKIMMRGFALALDLPEDWFDSKADRHASALRSLNYPTIGTPPQPGQIRASSHTDYGVMTILRSGGPGLQVQDLDNVWHDVPVKSECFVINLGDLMSRWTNDRWRSTPHRVINPPLDASGTGGERRQSMAYFCNLNMDAPVAAIPTCVSADRPMKYPETLAGDHLLAKHTASVKGILDDSWMKDLSN